MIISKSQLLDLFKSFFIYHNSDNERVIKDIELYFEQWYAAKFDNRKFITDEDKRN